MLLWSHISNFQLADVEAVCIAPSHSSHSGQYMDQGTFSSLPQGVDEAPRCNKGIDTVLQLLGSSAEDWVPLGCQEGCCFAGCLLEALCPT